MMIIATIGYRVSLAVCFQAVCFVGLLLVTSATTQAQKPHSTSMSPEITVKVSYRDKQLIGKPLAWDGKEMALLRRDGRMTVVPVTSEADVQTIRESFRSYSVEEMRSKLQREFGNRYQVSVTRNFIVVHPIGDYHTWAMPFENLYSRFKQYFTSRKFQLQNPEFPMVAVILNTREEFDYFLRRYHEYDSQILGYYSPKSNRVITYQQGEGKSAQWLFQTDTLIHEAVHQTAFNSGLHSRFAPVPRWISEGLAMLFEAPGINNSAYYTKLKDRINRGRLDDLKNYYAQGLADNRLQEIICDDSLYRSDPQLAYALSWGLTFYLSEKMPQQYFQFLRADAERPDFIEFNSAQRADAFARAFGGKLDQLEARMKQFITSLD